MDKKGFALKKYERTNALANEIRKNPVGKGTGTKGEYKAIGAVMAAEQRVIDAKGRSEKKQAREELKHAEHKAVKTLARGESANSQPRDDHGRWVKA